MWCCGWGSFGRSLLFDDSEKIGAVGGEAEELVADGVAGGVQGRVDMIQEIRLVWFARALVVVFQDGCDLFVEDKTCQA